MARGKKQMNKKKDMNKEREEDMLKLFVPYLRG